MILLQVSGLAKSVYYYTLAKTDKDDKNKEIIEEKLPKKPKKATLWCDENGSTTRRDMFWENVYKGILNQETVSEGIRNKGVSEIKFFDKVEEKSKRIDIRELLEHMYM